MPQPLRSVLAVLAGFLSMAIIVIALTLLCVKVFHLQSGHPSSFYLTLNVFYSLTAALVGGLITAKIARRSPLAHGVALALVMLVLNALSYRHGSAGWQPLWYRIFLTIAPPLAAILGARFALAPNATRE